jgi:isochorismate pyruvate lyase
MSRQVRYRLLMRRAMTMIPEQCKTMADIRTGVDAVDAELVALLARRFGYMNAAARIKKDRNAVRDEVRKAKGGGALADAR